MANHRKRKKHKAVATLTITDELYTIMRGPSRSNFQTLERRFGITIEGKQSLTIKHSDHNALDQFMTFFKDELITKAIDINDDAKDAYEKSTKDEKNPSPYRPGNDELAKFKFFFDEALIEFTTRSLSEASKFQKDQGVRAKASFNHKSAGKTPANDTFGQDGEQRVSENKDAAQIAFKDFEYRGPNDGAKQRTHEAAIKDTDTDLVFSIGNTGSGKTYMSLYTSLQMLRRGDIEKIYVIRPYVPSGRHRMGDVPGSENKKLAGLMKGVIGNVNKMLAPECGLDFWKMQQKGLIELQPLDKMRSMSFDNCVVLITEAQNVDYDQSDILERIGDNCTFILDGSLEQKDGIVAYPSLIDWTLQYADDPMTPFIFYDDDADIIRSAQSKRHRLARNKPMPEGYVDFRPLTPEAQRLSPMMQAIENNGNLARRAAAFASERTLAQYDVSQASQKKTFAARRKGAKLNP